MKKVLILVVFTVAVFGCEVFIGEEKLRIPMKEFSTQDTFIVVKDSMDMAAGEVFSVWSDIDIEYHGIHQIEFQIIVTRDQIYNLDLLRFDAFRKKITVAEVKTSDGNSTKWKFQGKMGEIQYDSAGNYRFEAIMIAHTPEKIKVNRADIVFRK